MEELSVLWHRPSTVRQATLYFDGYLTDEELNERQFSGRPWDIVFQNDYVYLYLVVDDETAVCVSFSRKSGTLKENVIQGKLETFCALPVSLRNILTKCKGNIDNGRTV